MVEKNKFKCRDCTDVCWFESAMSLSQHLRQAHPEIYNLIKQYKNRCREGSWHWTDKELTSMATLEIAAMKVGAKALNHNLADLWSRSSESVS